MKYLPWILLMLLMSLSHVSGQSLSQSAMKHQTILLEPSLTSLEARLKRLAKKHILQATEQAVKESVSIYQPQIEALEYRIDEVQKENLALKIGLGVAVVVLGGLYLTK